MVGPAIAVRPKPKAGNSRFYKGINRGAAAAGWTHKVVAESWERVEGPDPTVRIVVDPTAPPSYRGDRIVIDHAIWIRPEKARSSRWNMTRNESPLVVVA